MSSAAADASGAPGAQRPLEDGGAEHEEMFLHLERDQLVAETARPLPRATLSRRTTFALWSLRLFVIVIGAMVIYTFIYQLH